MNKSLLFTCTFLLSVNTIHTISVSPRYSQYCSYLNDSIYCYGGVDSQSTVLSDMHSVYVHDTLPSSTSDLSSAWKKITPSNRYGDTGRLDAQMVTSPDRSRMYIHGGYNQQSLMNPFLVYDAASNTWESLPDYRQYSINGQIYHATANYVPAVDKFVFYGGQTRVFGNRTVVVDSVTVDASMVGQTATFPFGFHNLTTFDMRTKQWIQIRNATRQDNVHFYYGMKSVTVPVSNTQYFFGGVSIIKTNVDIVSTTSFNQIAGVMYPDYQWETVICTGEIPTERSFFTTTLLPDNNIVLLYGGSRADTAVGDYCYTLNLKRRIWKKCSLEIPPSTNVIRFKHSAVLVKNHLFILFGRQSNEGGLSDMIVIDVTDTSNIKYAPHYAYHSEEKVIQEKESDGLGTGAIVGIVMGVLAMIIIILGVLFYMHRKRTKRPESVHDLPADWDKSGLELDNVPQTQNTHNTYSSESHLTAIPHQSDTSIIHLNSSHVMHTSSTSVVHPTTSGIHYPDSTDVVYPSTSGINHPHTATIIKPVEIITQKPHS
ncbi:hypothetical protein BDB01DRAFT_794743 [Pilobolus umbonatus]|nr:hypothetical protein BDB01DRAFT_794743 [Pilobolus umbonatus]